MFVLREFALDCSKNKAGVMFDMFDFNGNDHFDIMDAIIVGTIFEDEEKQRRREEQEDNKECNDSEMLEDEED